MPTDAGTTFETTGKPAPLDPADFEGRCWTDTASFDLFDAGSGDFLGTVAAPEEGFRAPLFADERTVLAAVADEDRKHWTGTALSERLLQLLEVRERLDAAITTLTAQWNTTRAWEIDGALSPTTWLAHRAPMAKPQANRLVHTAQLTVEHPQSSPTRCSMGRSLLPMSSC